MFLLLLACHDNGYCIRIETMVYTAINITPPSRIRPQYW